MNSIEDIYSGLWKYDTKNRLILNENKIEFNVNEKDKLIAYENSRKVCIEVALDGQQLTHFHYGYEEAYKYFLDIIESREPCPIGLSKKLKKIQKGVMLNIIIWSFLFFAMIVISTLWMYYI